MKHTLAGSVLLFLSVVFMFGCEKEEYHFSGTEHTEEFLVFPVRKSSTDSTNITVITYVNGIIDSTITYKDSSLVQSIVTNPDGQKTITLSYTDGSKSEFIDYPNGNYVYTIFALDSSYQIASYDFITKLVTNNCYTKRALLAPCVKKDSTLVLNNNP